jgi:hypothetical protein
VIPNRFLQNGANSVSVGGMIQSHKEKGLLDPKKAVHAFMQEMKSQEQPRPTKGSHKK